jgi:hypothetical protein
VQRGGCRLDRRRQRHQTEYRNEPDEPCAHECLPCVRNRQL